MRWFVVALAAVHGLIHLMGFAKSFGLAELPQLTQPIGRGTGVLWLLAAITMLATAALLVWSPRTWWAPGLVAVILSQAAIASSWGDAKVGTVANALILLGVIYGFASEGPVGLRAEYRREIAARMDRPASEAPPTHAGLSALPAPVQRYLSVTGSAGQPRVRHFRAKWRGRIRGAPEDPWMQFTAEQVDFVDEPARFFLMDAKRGGLPVDVLHVFRDGSATMRVRLLSLIPLVAAGGPDMTRAETVTLLNDLALLAPGAMIDSGVQWEPIDERSVRAVYTVGTNTVRATLHFNEAGELDDFVSDDRLAASADGTEFVRQRWSTPVNGYRTFGTRRAMSSGEGRWHPPAGEFSYIELELLELEING
jgi:hypothetical protein